MPLIDEDRALCTVDPSWIRSEKLSLDRVVQREDDLRPTLRGGRPEVDIPSYRLRPGQVVEVRERSRQKPPFLLAAAGAQAPDGPTPGYLHVEFTALRARLVEQPARQQVPVQCDVQMVVEFYSR